MDWVDDRQLRQISSKEFRKKTGITKTDYRFIRNLALAVMPIEGWSIYSQDSRQLTLHQFIKKIRNIDVVYITRLQKERMGKC